MTATRNEQGLKWGLNGAETDIILGLKLLDPTATVHTIRNEGLKTPHTKNSCIAPYI